MMEYAGNPGEGDGSSACIPNLRTINEKQESPWMLASLPPQTKLDRIRPEETKPKQTDKAGNKFFT